MSGQEEDRNSDTAFFEAMMKHIMQGVNIPKVQMERVLGPILGMFIEDVMSSLLGDKVVTLSSEFPLRKKLNKQSTNIDWLMYRQATEELLLVELKTTDTTFLPTQARSYVDLGTRISGESASFLIEDLKTIEKVSKESGKYRSVIKSLETRALDFSKIRSSRVIYILPELSEGVKGIEGISRYSFSDLFIERGNDTPFKKQWIILKNHLQKLDRTTKASRNELSGSKLNFKGILEHCSKSLAVERPVFVGFIGGLKKLNASTLEALECRMYKWSGNREGNKRIENWICAKVFLVAVENKMKN